MFGKIVAGVAGGFIVAFFASNVVTLVFNSQVAGMLALVIVWGAAFFIALKSPTGGKAWRWLLVSLAVLSFVVPITTYIGLTNETSSAGVIGGLVTTGFLSVVFFLLGLVFLAVAFVVGRDKPTAVAGDADQ